MQPRPDIFPRRPGPTVPRTPIPPRRKKRYEVQVYFQGRHARMYVYAQSRRDARAQIRRMLGRFGEIVKVRRHFGFPPRRPGPMLISELAQSMQAYIQAGVPILEMLRQHCLMFDHKMVSAAFAVAMNEVSNGKTLSQAFAPTRVFSDDVLEYLRLGEQTGSLDEILQEIADDHRVLAEIRGAVVKVLFYPVIIFIGAVLSMSIFRFFVYDVMVEMYHDFQLSVPFTLELVRLTIDTAPFAALGLIILAPVLPRLLGYYYRRRKLEVHRLLGRIPRISNILINYTLVRSFSSLKSSARARMDTPSTFRLLTRMTWYEPIRRAFAEVLASFENPRHPHRGKRPSQILMQHPDFPRNVASLIHTAEETGQIEKIYTVIRDNRRDSLKREVEHLGQWIEVTMIFMVGLAVLLIMVFFYLPYFQALGRIG